MCFMPVVLLEMVWTAGDWADVNAETARRARARCLGMSFIFAQGAPAPAVNQGSVMVGSLRCSRRRRWVRALRSSPVLGRVKAWAASDQSSLKLVACAEIQTWRMGVLGVMTKIGRAHG